VKHNGSGSTLIEWLSARRSMRLSMVWMRDRATVRAVGQNGGCSTTSSCGVELGACECPTAECLADRGARRRPSPLRLGKAVQGLCRQELAMERTSVAQAGGARALNSARQGHGTRRQQLKADLQIFLSTATAPARTLPWTREFSRAEVVRKARQPYLAGSGRGAKAFLVGPATGFIPGVTSSNSTQNMRIVRASAAR
jgi:hypothetical protein